MNVNLMVVKMRILLIQASGNPNRSTYDILLERISLLFPPSTISYLASLVPSRHQVTVIDENYENLRYNLNPDLVGISYFTASAPRAYEIADKFRTNGITVILGGYHASALPQEAKQHADSVIIGEAEKTWPQAINDFENRNLKSFYHQKTPINLNCYSKQKKYIMKTNIPIGGIEATRGCPYNCDFCAIANSSIGKPHRKKNIKKVINEIKNLPQKSFVFYDSSLTIDKEYSKELFRQMRPLQKKFACFGHANIADDEELLKLAQEAGCVAWSVGLETIMQKTLNDLNKTPNKVHNYKKMVKKLHEYGMVLIGSFVFGFDNDTYDVFDKTLDKINDLEIDSIGVSILTPLPGTRLFERLDKENRIFDKDWSKYDFYNVVFHPKNMSVDELYEGTKKVSREFHSIKNILIRLFNSKRLGLFTSFALMTHLTTSRIIYKSVFDERLLDQKFKNKYKVLDASKKILNHN